MRTRIIVAGSREFTDYGTAKEKLDGIVPKYSNTEIVCGGCRGADRLGERYAREHGIPVVYFPADWDRHGRAAGPIRNREMAEYAGSDAHGVLVAFWNGHSRGTADMITTAANHGCEIYKILI